MHYIGKVGCGTIGVVFAVVVILAFGIASMFNGPAVAPPTNEYDVEVSENSVEVARQQTEQVIADRAPDLEQQKGIADVNKTNAETNQFERSLAAQDAFAWSQHARNTQETIIITALTGLTPEQIRHNQMMERQAQTRAAEIAEKSAIERAWALVMVGGPLTIIVAALAINWLYPRYLAWRDVYTER